MHSSNFETTEMKDGGEVLVAIAALVTEGRIPGKLSSKTKSFYEGPHCPLNKTSKEHKCDLTDFLCSSYETVRKDVLNLWKKNIPVCLEVLLTCTCENDSIIKLLSLPSSEDFLLEKWYFSINHRRSTENLVFNYVQLMNAIRSQLYFSQLTAWLTSDVGVSQFSGRNIRYQLSLPGETFGSQEFSTAAIRHDFPLTDIGNGSVVTVSFLSLPRMKTLPRFSCGFCLVVEEVQIGEADVKEVQNGLVDDRMHTVCKLKGKHRCQEEEDLEAVKGTKLQSRSKLTVDIHKANIRSRQPQIEKNNILNNCNVSTEDKAKLLLDAIERSGRRLNSTNTSSSLAAGGDFNTGTLCDMSARDNRSSIRARRKLNFKSSSHCDSPKRTQCDDGVEIPTAFEQAKFRKEFDDAASMVFHSRTGLPLTSSPAPARRGRTCFDFDSSINSVSAIKSALFPTTFSTDEESESDGSIISPCSPETNGLSKRELSPVKYRRKGHAANLLGSFEESVLNGRLEPVSTVHGFSAELGASGSFVPKHLVVPVTVFFYTLGDNDKISSPYLSHINLGKKGYNVPKSGTIQVTLFNPLGTVVKMFVVMYDLNDMPPNSQTFIRQRTLYMPTKCHEENVEWGPKWLRYLIHLRFISSKSSKIYLHSDIRMIIFRKCDMDTATAHGLDLSYELRSYTHMPTNPRFSPRK